MKPIDIRRKKVQEFVSKYENKGTGINNAAKFFGYSRRTIQRYVKEYS